jgi:hypothetical protein
VNTIPVNFPGVNTVTPQELTLTMFRTDTNASTGVSVLSVSAGQRGADR